MGNEPGGRVSVVVLAAKPAVELASKIVGESLADEARQSRMVDRFLAELDEEAYLHFAGIKDSYDLVPIYERHAELTKLSTALALGETAKSFGRNARELRFEDIGDPVGLVTVDLSFISVTKVLPALVPLARPGADFLILVKPQFELERGQVGRGGIVRDPALRERAVEKVRAAAEALGLEILGVYPSRITGAEGNQEYFLHARKPG